VRSSLKIISNLVCFVIDKLKYQLGRLSALCVVLSLGQLWLAGVKRSSLLCNQSKFYGSGHQCCCWSTLLTHSLKKKKTIFRFFVSTEENVNMKWLTRQSSRKMAKKNKNWDQGEKKMK